MTFCGCCAEKITEIMEMKGNERNIRKHGAGTTAGIMWRKRKEKRDQPKRASLGSPIYLHHNCAKKRNKDTSRKQSKKVSSSQGAERASVHMESETRRIHISHKEEND